MFDNTKKGFSLVELLVVIAIIAVLAAIAVPAYKKYAIMSRLQNVVAVANTLMDRSITFGMSKGRYGNAYDLGLATSCAGPGYCTATTPSSLSPYLAGSGVVVEVGDTSTWTGPGPGKSSYCGAAGHVQITFNANLIGFPSNYTASNNNFIACRWWNYLGVIYKFCFYGFGVYSTLSETDGYISGWTNVNTNSSWNNVGFTSSVLYSSSPPNYGVAQCL